MSVEVFLKKFGDPLKGADDGLNKSINETIAEIATQAKHLAPVDKGQLKGSIMYNGPGLSGGHEEGPQIKQSGKKKVGYVGTAVFYGPYQEFGTRRTKPQPFLRPAVQSVLGQPKQTIIGIINNAIKKFTKGKISIVKF